MSEKCSFPDGITVRPDGVHGPCPYCDTKTNDFIPINCCQNCGAIMDGGENGE